MEGLNVHGGIATSAPFAGLGVVACRVDASYGAIRTGDLLVSSPTPGYAMRADAPGLGAIIGKAMESLECGTGIVHVIESLR